MHNGYLWNSGIFVWTAGNFLSEVRAHTPEVAAALKAAESGLESFFAENEGWTGTIAVLDGRTREATALIHGSRDRREYDVAIDKALRTP